MLSQLRIQAHNCFSPRMFEAQKILLENLDQCVATSRQQVKSEQNVDMADLILEKDPKVSRYTNLSIF